MTAKITVTTESADKRIVSVTQLQTAEATKAFLASAATADLERLTDTISDVAASGNGIGRPIWRHEVEMQIPGSGRVTLELPRWPLEGDPAEEGAGDPTLTELSSNTRVDDAAVHGQRRDHLFRRNGFTRRGVAHQGVVEEYEASQSIPDFKIEGWVGWIMPGQIAEWSSSLVVVANGSTAYGDAGPGWVRSTDRTLPLRFECTTSGTTNSTEPAGFATAAAGGTVTDGTAVFTARAAYELPAAIVEGALRLAAHLWQTRDLERGLRAEASDGVRRDYLADQAGALEDVVGPFWGPYR